MRFVAKRLNVSKNTVEINVKLIYEKYRPISTSSQQYQDEDKQTNHSAKLDLIGNLEKLRIKKAPNCVTVNENTNVIDNKFQPSVRSSLINHDKYKRPASLKLIEDLRNPPTKDVPPPITARRWIETITIINDNYLEPIRNQGSDKRPPGSNLSADKQTRFTNDAQYPTTTSPGTNDSQEYRNSFQLEDGRNFLNVIESCYKNHTSLFNEKSFVSNINTSIPSAAHKLRNFLETGNIKELSIRENDDEIVFKEVDQICCSWFDKFVDLECEETKKQAFSLASVWAQTLIWVQAESSSKRKYHLRQLLLSLSYLKLFLNHFLSNSKLNLLNPQELVFCMYLVKLIKYYPNVDQLDSRSGQNWAKRGVKFKKNKDYILNENLETSLLQHLQTLTISDIGIIMESLYSSRIFLGRENHKLKESLINVLLKLDDRSIQSNSRGVSAIFKVLSTRDYTIGLDQMNHVMKKFVPLMPTLNMFLLLRSAEFFSDAFPDNREYFLKTFILSIEKYLVECRIKDIHSIAEVLSKLNYEKGMNEPFMKKFVEAGKSVKSNETDELKIWVNNAVQFIFFNQCLANMGYFCTEYLNRIFEVVNSSPELDSSETTEEILTNGVASISCIGDMNVRNHFHKKSFQKKIKEQVSHDAALMRGAVSKIFYLDCMIEICVPKYKGVRLKESLKHKLSKLVVRTNEIGMDYQINNKIILSVCSALNIRTANHISNDYLYLGYLSPEASTFDIAFCVDVESSIRSLIKVMPLPKRYVSALDECIHVVRPEDYSDFEEQNSNLSMSKKFRWIAICTPQKKYNVKKDINGELLRIPSKVGSGDFHSRHIGPFNVRVQKLEALGYTVIPLTYDLLDKCINNNKVRDLRKLIINHCVA